MDTIIKRLISGLTVPELLEIKREANMLLGYQEIDMINIKNNISARLYNVIRDDLGFTNLMEVAEMKRHDFANLKNVGTLTLQEIDNLFNHYNMVFNSHQYSLNYIS